jgi:hypothetical protein
LPVAAEPVSPQELLEGVLLTALGLSGAGVGVIVLLQDDALVLRASSGLDPTTAAHLALERLGELCLDVITGAAPVRASEPNPVHPGRAACAPLGSYR